MRAQNRAVEAIVAWLMTRRRRTALLLAAVAVSSASACSPRTPADRESVAVPWRDRASAVVLAVDPRAVADRSAAEGLDQAPDLEWVNLLTQEFGSCDRIAALEIEASPRGRLAGRRILVLPRATLGALAPQALADLEVLVEEGLTVIAEQPDTTHAAHFGLRVATVERTAFLPWPTNGPRTAAGPRGTLGGIAPRPLEFPHLVGRYAPAEDPRRRARVAADVAGRPAIWSLERGKGAWVSLAHELGTWSVRWRQDPRSAAAARDGAHWIESWVGLIAQNDATPAPWPRFAAHPPSAIAWVVLDPASAPVTPARPWTGSAPLLVRDAAGQMADAWSLPSATPSADPSDPLAGLRADLRRMRGTFRGLLQIPLPDADPQVRDDLGARARAAGAVATSAPALSTWWQARERSRLDWDFDGEVLSIAVEVDADAGDGLVLLLPRQWRERRLVDWDAGWSPARAEVAERDDRPVLYLDVPAGTRAQARAVYR